MLVLTTEGGDLIGITHDGELEIVMKTDGTIEWLNLVGAKKVTICADRIREIKEKINGDTVVLDHLRVLVRDVFERGGDAT